MSLRKKYYLTTPEGKVFSFTSINQLLNSIDIPWDDKLEIVKPFRTIPFQIKEDKEFYYEKLQLKIEYRY